MNRLITTMLIAITIFTLGSGIVAADEYIVQPSDSIQAAVDSAVSGDVITVKPGTYSGSVTINTENLTIRSESGNPEDTVIQATVNDTSLFSVKANKTTISGFKVTADGHSDVTGIHLYKRSNCTIFNNIAESNKYGIILESECNNNNLTVTV